MNKGGGKKFRPAPHLPFISFPLLSCLILLLILLIGCRENLPEIFSLDPPIDYMGQILTIKGTGFGNERNESYITIGGIPPTSSSYLSWSDNEIVLRTPEFGDAGLVYVHRGRNRSNPALFANMQNLPFPPRETEGINPRIISIEPASGPIGSLITIYGRNFGSSRNTGAVYFTWDAEPSPAAPVSTGSIPAAERELAYEFWSDREIRVRIPDGAASGNMEVRTIRGDSPPVYLEISGRPGTKTFRNRQNYILSYSVNINVLTAMAPNSLFLFMPLPVSSSSQRNASVISRSREPFIENYLGTSIFQINNLLPGNTPSINQSFHVEVYEVETDFRTLTPPRLNSPLPANSVFTTSSYLIPSDNPQIIERATAIIGRETLVYTRARLIYQWLIANMEFSSGESGDGSAFSGIANGESIVQALSNGRGSSFEIAMLYTSLLRSAGISAMPVSGILVDPYMDTYMHFWTEFWMDGFGWIPVDPALGAGAAPPLFLLRENHEQYYFGNLDNHRITFSRGEYNLMQMTPQSRIVTPGPVFSLQNLSEEAAGGLDSYTSVWSNISVSGMYVQ